MDRPRIALLLASHNPDDTRRNFDREVPAELVEFQVTEGALPGEDEDLDGYIVTGSKSSVYDDEEWIADTIEWVRSAHERGIPGLGVCFGHQLLASAFGGTVEDIGEYELGYRELTHDPDPIFDDIDREFLAFETHSDRVTDLPADAEVLSENEYGIQAFRLEYAVGVQFHPEYDLETARRIAEEKPVGEEKRARVLAGVTEANRQRAAEAAIVFENFVEEVEHRQSARTRRQSTS